MDVLDHYGLDIHGDKLGLMYPSILAEVKEFGLTVPSRVGETKEVIDMRLTLTQPEYCIVGRPKFSYRLMEVEYTQLLAGRYDPDLQARASKVSADLIAFSTAYGPRVWEHDQLGLVCDELHAHPTSRRAVVYVGNPQDLWAVNEPVISETRKGEMPCTQTWQFFVREGALHMLVNMRSWDLVWGLSYDIPSFVAVQLAVAEDLGLPVGLYMHRAGSAHVYDRHYDLETWETEDKLEIPWLAADIGLTKTTAMGRMVALKDALTQEGR